MADKDALSETKRTMGALARQPPSRIGFGGSDVQELVKRRKESDAI